MFCPFYSWGNKKKQLSVFFVLFRQKNLDIFLSWMPISRSTWCFLDAKVLGGSLPAMGSHAWVNRYRNNYTLTTWNCRNGYYHKDYWFGGERELPFPTTKGSTHYNIIILVSVIEKQSRIKIVFQDFISSDIDYHQVSDPLLPKKKNDQNISKYRIVPGLYFWGGITTTSTKRKHQLIELPWHPVLLLPGGYM